MELDAIDRKVLGVLDRNARSSLSEIGKFSRLSKSAVAQRIRKLEQDGVISGYYAVIDSSRLGFLSFRVYVKFYQTSPKNEADIIRFLMGDKHVWWLGLIQGDWNVGFVVWVTDLYDFRNFWFDFLSRFRPNVGRHEITPYVKLRHFAPVYFAEAAQGSQEAGIVGEGPRISLDDSDKRILKAIAENARVPVVELAKQTFLTPAIVAYRLKQLLRKGVIVRFRPKINSSKLGYSLYKLEFILDDLTKLSEMQAFSRQLPNLLYIDETIGGADLEAEFQLRSEQELAHTLDLFKARFHSSIREINYIVYSKVLKYSYYPSD